MDAVAQRASKAGRRTREGEKPSPGLLPPPSQQGTGNNEPACLATRKDGGTSDSYTLTP